VEDGHPRKSGEVTITRRLYRSGESEYLIDGRAARLRDIQEVSWARAWARESYAIIEQGRIGQILSSKPQDRRNVIEEAAGITKFKTKKRLAEQAGRRQAETWRASTTSWKRSRDRSIRSSASLPRRSVTASSRPTWKRACAWWLSGKYRLIERDAADTAARLEKPRRRN